MKPVQVDPVCPSRAFPVPRFCFFHLKQTKCMEKKKRKDYVKIVFFFFWQEEGLSFDSWQRLEWRHFI